MNQFLRCCRGISALLIIGCLTHGSSARALGCSPEEPCELPPPNAPTSITYPGTNNVFPVTITTNSYVVTWPAVVAAGYYILEEQIGTGAWVSVVAPSSNSFSFTNKANGNYTYRVKSCGNDVVTSGCSIGARTGGVLTVNVPPPPPPGPIAPTVTQTLDRALSWVLIHGDVPVLVPAFANAPSGTVALTWATVTGATSYQYRQWNEQSQTWGPWQSLAGQTYLNYYSETQATARFEFRSCNASGCGAGTEQTVNASPWRNVGTCNINTGEQQQVCISGTCLNQLRYVAGCAQRTTCNVQ